MINAASEMITATDVTYQLTFIWILLVGLLISKPEPALQVAQVELRAIWPQSERQDYPKLRPIAALSSGEPIQYPYLAMVLKNSRVSSGVGGAADSCGSNGLVTSRKNWYNFDVVTTTIVAGSAELLRKACFVFARIITTSPAVTLAHAGGPFLDWKASTVPSRT